MLYFTINTLARLGQGLHTTTLELTVLGMVFCMAVSTWCWWHKPVDVEQPHRLELKASLTSILLAAGDVADEPYRETPLDFVTPNDLIWDAIWNYHVILLRKIGVPEFHTERPMQKMRTIAWSTASSRWSEALLFIFSMIYLGSFFGAWSFYFPTKGERIAWLACSAFQVSMAFVVPLIHAVSLVSNRKKNGGSERVDRTPCALEKTGAHVQEQDQLSHSTARAQSLQRKEIRRRNTTVELHPLMLLPIFPCGALYILCRWYLLFEDLANLRSLPLSTFDCVDWTRYLPYF